MKKILVSTASALTFVWIKDLLVLAGDYECRHAGSLQEAARLFREFEPDAVIVEGDVDEYQVRRIAYKTVEFIRCIQRVRPVPTIHYARSPQKNIEAMREGACKAMETPDLADDARMDEWGETLRAVLETHLSETKR